MIDVVDEGNVFFLFLYFFKLHEYYKMTHNGLGVGSAY